MGHLQPIEIVINEKCPKLPRITVCSTLLRICSMCKSVFLPLSPVPSAVLQAGQLKSELEHAQCDHLEATKKFEKLQGDYSRLQEHSTHQKSQLESCNDKVKSLENTIKKLQGDLERQQNTAALLTTTGKVPYNEWHSGH